MDWASISDVITRVLKVGEEGRRDQSDGMRVLSLPLLALKMEEEARAKEYAAPGSWKRQGKGSSPGARRKECSSADTLTAAP